MPEQSRKSKEPRSDVRPVRLTRTADDIIFKGSEDWIPSRTRLSRLLFHVLSAS